jgi:hypothetical protein
MVVPASTFAETPEPGFKSRLDARVRGLGAEPAYANYLKVREAVFRMMDDWARLDPSDGPSAYWREEAEGFAYLFDASPLVIGALREHCHHITGIKAYDYRAHHAHQQPDYLRKFRLLRSLDAEGLFVPEPEALGGFGFDVGEGLANLDTLKFYEVLLGLQNRGLLQRFRGEHPQNRVVAEIGSGWGGFAYQFKALCPKATFVCVDLPPTLLFSAVYLMTLFPDARTLLYGEPGFEAKLGDLESYDFVFLPHFHFMAMPKMRIDLAINMVSFQEMTTQQVEAYAARLREFGCADLYSLNRDRSKHNTELSTVSEALGRHYELTRVGLLDEPYTQLAERKKPREPAVTGYRHLHGHG